MGIVYGVLEILLVYAAYVDIRKQRIPNRLCSLIVLIGLVANSLLIPDRGFFYSMVGICAGFLPLFFLHILTGLGAGDVKLMAAIGSVVGAKSVLIIFCYSFVMSGGIALGYLFYRRGIKDMIQRYGRFIFSVLKGRPALDKPSANSAGSMQMPMAPGIALATTYVLLPNINAIFSSDHVLWNTSWI